MTNALPTEIDFGMTGEKQPEKPSKKASEHKYSIHRRQNQQFLVTFAFYGSEIAKYPEVADYDDHRFLLHGRTRYRRTEQTEEIVSSQGHGESQRPGRHKIGRAGIQQGRKADEIHH